MCCPVHHKMRIRYSATAAPMQRWSRREVSGMESLEDRAERDLQEAERVRGAAERTEDPENRTVLLDIAVSMKRRQRWSRSCVATDSQKRTPPSPAGLS